MKTMEVICGILEQDGKYLIARRGKGVRENIWEFPGGKVEPEETKEEAVVREIQEELEYQVEVCYPVTQVWDVRSDCRIHVTAFLCRILSGNMVLHAHHEARFVEAHELFDYTFEEADHAILECLNRR